MKTYITKRKFNELRQRLIDLEKDYRRFADTELAEAVALGDIRENAEYDSAQWRQSHMAALIAELHSAVSSQIIFIDELKIDPSAVSIGTEVTLREVHSGQLEKYAILGPHESDAANGVISYLAPFAKQLIRKKVGNEIAIGSLCYKIECIALAKFSKP